MKGGGGMARSIVVERAAGGAPRSLRRLGFGFGLSRSRGCVVYELHGQRQRQGDVAAARCLGGLYQPGEMRIVDTHVRQRRPLP